MARKTNYREYKAEYNAFLKDQRKKKREPVMRILRPILIVLAVALIGFGVYELVTHPEFVDAAAQQVETVADNLPSFESEPITLTPGEYVAGTDFPAGRYLITTDERRSMISTDTAIKTLQRGDDGYTCTLEKGEELDCTGTITLTPVK